ncbi:MAG: hypothetical protein IAE87_03120, partial [Rhodobacteraceae bacterium]|nr:hypothetical protein [Paracoccaceae bacterium]
MPPADDPGPATTHPAAERRRLMRQIDLLARRWPRLLGWLRALQCRWCVFLRVPLGLVLILGGIFSFLPVLGVWMLPIGLMLLAFDIPLLQRPVTALLIRFQAWMRRRDRRAAEKHG